MNRRTFLLATAAVTSTTGCTSLLSDEPLEFEATQAAIPQSVQDETGYAQTSVEDLTIERTVEFAGQRETIVVTNWQTQHAKQLNIPGQSDPLLAFFTILTSPKVEVLGREFNPIGNMSNEDLANRVQNQYDEIQNVELDEESTVTVLGTETKRSRFAAETQIRGATINLFLHLSNPVSNEGDLVLSVGGHPQLLQGEEAQILRLMEAITHPA